MFISNLLITLRSLRKNKVYSLINIVGLSAGLAACLLVAAIVIDELSYDKQWTKADRIYRTISVNNRVKGSDRFPLTFTGLGPSLKKDFPEVEDYCRMSVIGDRLKIGANSDGVAVKNLMAEASVWNFLDFKVTEGNPKKYIEGYANLIITEKFKQEHFKGQDPVGKIYYTIPEWGSPQQYLVTGVVKELPLNTHLRADVISITKYRPTDDELAKEEYGTFSTQYLLLKPGTDVNKFTAKVNNWYTKFTAPNKPGYSYLFQPFKDVYLKSDFSEAQPVHGSMRNIYIFSAVAVLLLVIACFNFMTLTTSRVFSRMQETGVRKVLGASKRQLIIRYITESVLFFCLAFVLAGLLYKVFVPYIETYMGHQLVFSAYNASFIVAAIIAVLAVSILTGIYPAWYLSQPQPITILRNQLPSGSQLNWLKKTLVVGQFVISIGIIIATLVVHYQLNYISKIDLGFDKNNLVKLEYSSWGNSGERFKQQLKQLPGIESVSITSWSPGIGAVNMSTEIPVPGQTAKIVVNHMRGDADLPAVLKVKLKSGRVFSPDLRTDNINGDSLNQLQLDGVKGKIRDSVLNSRPVIVTEYTAKLLNVKLNEKAKSVEGIPVGIISDFHNESLHFGMKPCVIDADKSNNGYILIRLKPNHPANSLTAINTLLKSIYPDKPFLYEWVGDVIDAQYKNEAKLKQLFFCFSMLIVFLSCLGLFGLITFNIQQRVKEIGIRKVLGASVAGIATMLSTDFVKLVILALAIAAPLAGYLMTQWLQDFAYRITLNWWIFGLAGLIAILIAVITISFQAIKAALANPVKSLRSE
ncbi:FtsX-like permease family protein [Mucilaginibacter limnophilus]|uniref:FtsX-like permease family protein n=1 Tax=Mucilaginibacter limnophilus TaxID=1932778 RepID=A0A3S2Y3L4_9SPHI|nr:FtsX-like permease family protein [Mucilaginibacter limnophilus]RVU02742.1 FtsX-like permease family protein [Mucilaginibacter limnophilus]